MYSINFLIFFCFALGTLNTVYLNCFGDSSCRNGIINSSIPVEIHNKYNKYNFNKHNNENNNNNSITSKVHCKGIYSCYNSYFNETNELICDGGRSCENMRLKSQYGKLECSGLFGCADSNIAINGSITCSSYMGCSGINVEFNNKYHNSLV